MNLPPALTDDFKLWLKDCEPCATCGELIRRNPYPPFGWYHAEGNARFDHEPQPKAETPNSKP